MFLPQNITILYVEFDLDLQKSTASSIHDAGYKVFLAETSINAYEIFKTHKIDIIILNCQLEDENALELIQLVREKNFLLPVIITTSETNEQLLFKVLNLDILHCLIKPYSNEELLETLLIASKNVLLCHPLSITNLKDGWIYNPVNKSIITPDGKSINLSKKEYLFIELLLHNAGHIIPYSLIESTVWENCPMSMDALRTLVLGIRKKVYPDMISNHNGIGYKLDI